MAGPLPLLRGTAEYADCENCPLSKCGQPSTPVFSEFPENPAWLMIGESPGINETRINRPFIGASGDVVNKILSRIGRPRAQIFIGNVMLCQPPQGADEKVKLAAARACSTRLKMELARFAGKPILTLGAIAAKSVIPKPVLDAIDPPEVAPSNKKKAKDKQKAAYEDAKKREKAIARLTKAVRKQLGTAATLANVATLVDQRYSDEVAAALQKRLAKKKELKITDIVGTTFRVDVDGTGERVVVPAVHPAAILRGGGRSIAGTHTPDLAFWNILYDAGKVDGVARGKNLDLNLQVDVAWDDPGKAARLVRELWVEARATGSVAIDLETYVEDPDRHHALMAYVAKIRAIGLSTTTHSISVMWDLLPAWAIELIRQILRDRAIIKVFHNGLYDRTVFRANGFACYGEWDDTLLAHHACFPGMAHNLQSVTSQFFTIRPWKAEFRNSEETPEGLTTYCAYDTGSTAKLVAPLTILVKRNKVERIYALDKKMAEAASGMHLDGVPISREVNEDLLQTFSVRVREAKEKVEHVANDPAIKERVWHNLAFYQAMKQRKADPYPIRDRHSVRLEELRAKDRKGKYKWKASASLHVAALLKAIGVELSAVTESGQVSTKKDVLESLVHIPLVRDIIDFREAEKLLSTFVWPLFDRRLANGLILPGFADANDRVHPIWSIHKITGRWGSRDPVESNVPKEKIKKLPDGTIKILRPNLRAQVVARRGRKLVGFDFAQLEARVIALISGDPWLLTVFASGKDIHKECASLVWPGFYEMDKEVQKKLRNDVKPFEYGAFYGAAAETLYRNLLKEGYNVQLQDVVAILAKLMGGMPLVKRWQQNSVYLASQPPHEITSFLFNRRRVFPLGQVEPNEAINFPAQSSAADLMNNGLMIMMDRIGQFRNAFPILQIHDAAVFECDEDDAEALSEVVRDSFTQEYTVNGITIPFPIDLKIAQSWADL